MSTIIILGQTKFSIYRDYWNNNSWKSIAVPYSGAFYVIGDLTLGVSATIEAASLNGNNALGRLGVSKIYLTN